MSARQKAAQPVSTPSALPSVLEIGRQIVRLSNKCHELECAILHLKEKGLPHLEEFQQAQNLQWRMDRSFEMECMLVDLALDMRARTLGDVAVMLKLAWRVADGHAASEFQEEDRTRALGQIKHARLTSLDVVIRETGLDLEETVGGDARFFIDREHADLEDGL